MRLAGQSKEALELLGILLSVDRQPTSEVWDRFFRPQQDYLLDPVALADAYGTDATRRVVKNTLAWEQGLRQAPIDAGAAALDMMLRRVGIGSNLSGVLNPPTVRYPISPEVHYKRQFKPVTGPSRRTSTSPGTIVEYIGLTDTPMMDWDIPHPSHMSRNVTIKNLGDVEDLVRDYVGRNPRSMLQVYQTPGGFRAWELGERMSPADFQPRFADLKVDPDYAMLSNTGFGRTVRGVEIDPPSFRSRISHKPDRIDWVAQPIATFEGADAIAHPRSVAMVRNLHDEPIRQRYLTMGGASPAAMRQLKLQLPTTSRTLRMQLERKFGL